MSVSISRNYKFKDVEMLLATATIIENAIANKTFLQTKRATWADPFFADLSLLNKSTTETYLGKDAAKQMRQATQIVLGIQSQALNDLAELKIQIQQDFKNQPANRDEILNELGFTPFYKMAQKKDQEALVSLLYQFKTNLTPTLKTEIVSRGTAQLTLDTIVDYADTLKDANISQEIFKGTREEITDEALTAFNDIYDKVMSVAKIASNFYKTDKTKQQLFNYNKIASALNSN